MSLANELFGCDFAELIELKQAIPTCDEHFDWNKPTQEILSEQNETIVRMKQNKLFRWCAHLRKLRII